MKKLMLAFFLFAGMTTIVSAREKKVEIKKTSTILQNIHDTFSEHKKYSGTKAKVKIDKSTTETKQ